MTIVHQGHQQRGIALIQALLLAAVLGLLILGVGQRARQQIALARVLSERTEAELLAQSNTAIVTYALLTEPWTIAAVGPPPPVGSNPRKPGAATLLGTNWNFRGQPFDVAGATVSIRDENGRLAVPLFAATDFVRLLAELGVDAARAARLGDQLMRLQALGFASASGSQSVPSILPSERRYPVQRIDELRALPDMDDTLFARLQPLMTTYPTPGLNPVTADPPVLAARLPPVQRATALELRSRGQLDADALWRIAGIEADEATVLFPGPAFTVTVDAGKATMRVRHTELIVIQPYRSEAVTVWSRTTGEPPIAAAGPG